MLPNLEVRRFKAFEHLVVEKLGRVNLIVGKNNVGKTALLEALRVYGSADPLTTVGQLLVDREELAPRDAEEPRRSFVPDVMSLFHGRSVSTSEEQISIGVVGAEAQVRLRIEPHRKVKTDIGWTLEPITDVASVTGLSSLDIVLLLAAYRNGVSAKFSFEGLVGDGKGRAPAAPPLLTPRRPDSSTIGRWWDSIALKPSEQHVLEWLQTLAPVVKMSLVQDPSAATGRRIAKVLLAGSDEPVPLRSLGDGLGRLFEIALALECAREEGRVDGSKAALFPGMLTSARVRLPALLLIDELENGLHYSLLDKVWRALFAAARRLELQVFVTSHSWDCLESFQAVAQSEADEGVLVRLEHDPAGHLRAVCFSESELAIVTRDGIEVR